MPIGQHYGWMHDMMGWGGWMIPWGWILIVILVVILIYALAGRGGQRTSEPSRGSHVGEKQYLETPLSILKNRYARAKYHERILSKLKRTYRVEKGLNLAFFRPTVTW
jgi:uncharacterized membrane protein